jgi:hypothetical protein
VTVAATSIIPGVTGISVTLVYYATVLAIASVNVVLFRGKVFNSR